MKTFYYEITDLFGNELENSFINRYAVQAITAQAALSKLCNCLLIDVKLNEKQGYFKIKSRNLALYQVDMFTRCTALVDNDRWMELAYKI